ncbi:MAG: hypothetical protein KDB90_16610 [Planctomycetes bacterium]|nr:hypothetical protein [Planctomycetota bacterium]
MQKVLFWTAAAALILFSATRPAFAGDDDGGDAEKKREDLFGKSFGKQIEDAVDKGCDWLKKQQGLDSTAPKEVFGKKPDNPTYEAGTPHQYWIARTAFPIQALCKSGCFVDDPAIDSAMKWLRENYTENGAIGYMQGSVGSSTYEDATVLNAVEAYYVSAWETHERGFDNPKKRYVKDDDGNKIPVTRWGTEEVGAKKKKKDRNFKLDRKDQKICEIAVKALEARFRKGAYGGAGWRYAKPGMAEQDPMVDVSASQYAILGLKAATRLGIKYDKGMLVEVFRFLRGQQDKDGPEVKAKWKKAKSDDDKKGRSTSSEPPEKTLHARGWGYCRQSSHSELDKSTYGSMTAAAINALILIRDEMVDDPGQRKVWDKVEEDCNLMIGDGLAWMVANWSMEENPKAGMHRFYYYLYTIERLGMLGGIDEIGSHDWYIEGAQVLLKQQTKGGAADGAWDVGNEISPSDVYDTCYALLFLKRATSGVDRPIPVITGDGGD